MGTITIPIEEHDLLRSKALMADKNIKYYYSVEENKVNPPYYSKWDRNSVVVKTALQYNLVAITDDDMAEEMRRLSNELHEANMIISGVDRRFAEAYNRAEEKERLIKAYNKRGWFYRLFHKCPTVSELHFR
jgi:hypothetical protein